MKVHLCVVRFDSDVRKQVVFLERCSNLGHAVQHESGNKWKQCSSESSLLIQKHLVKPNNLLAGSIWLVHRSNIDKSLRVWRDRLLVPT